MAAAKLTANRTGDYDTHLRTGKVRLSFPHLFEKYEKSGKYQAHFMIPKSDKKCIDLLEKCIEEAKSYGKATKWGNTIPKKLKISIKDGDEDADEYPEQAGHMIVTAKTSYKPDVYDKDGSEAFDAEDLYAGCYVQAIIEAYPYDSDGSKGVAFALLGVKKIAEGERFGGGGSSVSSDDFDAADEEDEDDDLGL